METPARPARLEDIAQRVGISRSEVSRVLNGKVRVGRSIGKAKQEEIQKVARELNYQPHQAARNLAQGRTDTVALPVEIERSRPLAPHYQEIIPALTLALHEQGLRLLLTQVQGDPLQALERLVSSRVCDGIVLTDMRVDDARPAALGELGIPFVIRGSAPSSGLPAVGMNNARVGWLAVETLARHGHRRILCHHVGQNYLAGLRRCEGAHGAAERAGIASTVRHDDSQSGEEGGYALAHAALTGSDRPTALFAADELAAFGMLRAIADLGLSVPEDVSLLTCLNARILSRVHPTLSFVNVRQEEVAREAGKLLARRLHGEAIPMEQSFLEPILVDNGSLAPPSMA